MNLVSFGVGVCQSLKSNAIALVRQIPHGFQLVGAGQGQPNRIEALTSLAIPRALRTLNESSLSGGLSDCILISDAFFPFPDAVESAAKLGIQEVVQPGGSRKDKEVIQRCDDLGVAMLMTGMRHFRHS